MPSNGAHRQAYFEMGTTNYPPATDNIGLLYPPGAGVAYCGSRTSRCI